MKPRIKLIYPDGSTEWYSFCTIEDSLIPDLSFTGTSINSGKVERVVTNLAYKIVTEPTPAPPEVLDLHANAVLADLSNAIPWRKLPPEASIA